MFGKKKKKKALNEQNETSQDTMPEQESVQEKPKEKPKKQKKGFSLFGSSKRSKSPIRLTDAMQLEESVASSSVDVLGSIVTDHVPSAVRFIEGDGYVIVALTNTMLSGSTLDVKSEEFGSFAEGLRNETIESITLPRDIEDGVIGLIPTLDTLQALEEFEFLDHVQYQYALVPKDITDDQGIILLDTTVSFDELLATANDFNLTYQLSGAHVDVVSLEGLDRDDAEESFESFDSAEQDFTIDEHPDDAVFDEVEEEPPHLLPPSQMDDAPVEFIPTYTLSDSDDVDDVDNMDDDMDVADGMAFDTEPTDTTFTDATYGSTDLTEDEAAERQKQVVFQISNPELGIELTTEKFDDYFANQPIVNFEIVDDQGNELQRTLNEMRRDANSELERMRHDGIQSLRQKFISALRQTHDLVTSELDYREADTRYFDAFMRVEERYQQTLNRRFEIESERTREAKADFEERKAAYVEDAKRAAEATFQRIYGDEHRRAVQNISLLVSEEIEAEREASRAEIYADRRMVASNMFERVITTLLAELTQNFNMLAEQELSVYDGFRQNMEIYLRKHYSDEVLRAKAEAEKLRQMHEAERVREEYDQMLITKTRMLEEQEATYREKLDKLDLEHRQQLEEMRKETERLIERERKDNDTLRESVRQANQSNEIIIEQKDKEIEHRMKTLENMLEAKDAEIRYVAERSARSERPMKFITGSIGAVALVVGILFGFLFGASNTAKQVTVDTPTTQQANQTNQTQSNTSTTDGTNSTDSAQ